MNTYDSARGAHWILMRMLLGCTLVGCVSLGGCSTMNTYSRDKRLVTDDGLERRAQVDNIRMSRVSGDLLRVQVDIRNLKDSDQEFNYRFEWLDEGGNKIGSSVEVWKRQQIGPQETITLTEVATSPSAIDFRLKMIDVR